MQIRVKSLKVTNFRSITSLAFSFPLQPGFRYLTGKNEKEPKLGANGAGKSSFWQAINWILFGATVDGLKTGQLINREVEKKVSSGELVLEIDGIQVTVARSGPPERLTINGSLKEQSDLRSLIKLSKEGFIHSVLFGQDQRLFPDLPIPERSALLEEVLDFSIWNKCAEQCSLTHAEQERLLALENAKLSRLQGRLEGVPSPSSLDKAINDWEVDRQNRLAYAQTNFNNWLASIDTKIDALQKEIKPKIEAIPILEEAANEAKLRYEQPRLDFSKDLASAKKQLQDSYSKAGVLFSQLTSIAANAKAFQTLNQCPTCLQQVSVEYIKTKLAEYADEEKRIKEQKKQEELNATNLVKLVEDLNQKHNNTITEVSMASATYKNADNALNTAIGEVERMLNQRDALLAERALSNPFDNQIKTIIAEANPFIAQKLNVERMITSITNEIDAQRTNIQAAQNRLNLIFYWKTGGFKKLRMYLLNQVIEVLQLEINAAIVTLGMTNWRVEIRTETENKSGTIKLGTQIIVHTPTSTSSYEACSGGEKQRLRIAIALGVASLIQRYSQSNWDLEVFDEYTEGLSPEGVQDLMTVLDYRAQVTKKHLWIVDHTALTYSNFAETLTIVKKENGETQIV